MFEKLKKASSKVVSGVSDAVEELTTSDEVKIGKEDANNILGTLTNCRNKLDSIEENTDELLFDVDSAIEKIKGITS